MRKTIAFFDEPTDFSLVQGGPLFQLLLRTGLLKPPTDLLARRIVVISLVAWLPLLVLSVLSGHAVGGSGVPFLFDVGRTPGCSCPCRFSWCRRDRPSADQGDRPAIPRSGHRRSRRSAAV